MAWDRLQILFVSVTACVCLFALSRSHFLIDFRQKWQRGKNH